MLLHLKYLLVHFMFDILQFIFWSITYILTIISMFHNRKEKSIAIPYIAVILNFSWEICAAIHSNGFWGHIVWLCLDLFIVFLCLHSIDSYSQKAIFVLTIVFTFLILHLLFKYEWGMSLSVFAIDLIMAVAFLFTQPYISSLLKLPIAITKLLGDLFAGLYYFHTSIAISIIIIIVFFYI